MKNTLWKKVSKYSSFCLIMLLVLTLSCGKRKGPTGGPKDTEVPGILDVFPAELSDLTGKDLEITFSKPMDKESFYTGLLIYPPVNNKKLRWDGNTLIIKFKEELKQNTNYYVTFRKSIKCEHGNLLENDYTYIFSSGELNTQRISGTIQFEKSEDTGREVMVSLYSADSTFIYSKIFCSSSFEFSNLNYDNHLIRAFSDLNDNRVYDQEDEPFFEKYLEKNEVISQDLILAYADFTKPVIRKAVMLNNSYVEVELSESISKIEKIAVEPDSIGYNLKVLRHNFVENILDIVCEEADTLNYILILKGLTDLKGNVNDSVSIKLKGITIADELGLDVPLIFPRDGSVIRKLKPEIVVEFKEIVDQKNIIARLSSQESGESVKLVAYQDRKNMRIMKFMPETNLTNYSSYIFAISKESKDLHGNKMKDDISVRFVPIINELKLD